MLSTPYQGLLRFRSQISEDIFFFCLFFLVISIYGCSPSKETKEETETTETKTETTYEEQSGTIIMHAAKAEQENPMYSKDKDSTYLYWLNNKLILLSGGQTKCNIYALNTLFKAGFKTPEVNVLTRDLMDTSRFSDILPVVGISEPDLARKGDLISWYGHVIIFDELVKIKNDLYAQAWWAGTRQADNGENIINNVVYGKYKLRGHYVIRRPVRQ